MQYVYLVADWHLNKRLGVAAAAFGRGLAKVSCGGELWWSRLACFARTQNPFIRKVQQCISLA